MNYDFCKGYITHIEKGIMMLSLLIDTMIVLENVDFQKQSSLDKRYIKEIKQLQLFKKNRNLYVCNKTKCKYASNYVGKKTIFKDS